MCPVPVWEAGRVGVDPAACHVESELPGLREAAGWCPAGSGLINLSWGE